VICLTPEVCDADQRIEEGFTRMDGEAGIRIVQQMKGSMSQIRYPNPSISELLHSESNAFPIAVIKDTIVCVSYQDEATPVTCP
jgi:hypothetical protein